MSDLAGHHLIDRGARINVGAGCFLNANTRQKCTARSRVIAATIRARVGAKVLQPGNDLQLMLDFLQRLQSARKRKVPPAVPARPPGRRDRAVGDIHNGHSHGRRLRRGGRRAEKSGGRKRFKSGQRHAGAKAAQKTPPTQTGLPFGR